MLQSEKYLYEARFEEASKSTNPQAFDSLEGIKTEHKVRLTIQYLRVQRFTDIVRMQQTPFRENYQLLQQYMEFVEKKGTKLLKAQYFLAYSSALRGIGNQTEANEFEERAKVLFRKLKRRDKVAEIRANQLSRLHNELLSKGNRDEILALIPKYNEEIEYSSKHSDYALSYNTRHLGQIYRRQTDEFEKALDWFEQSLALRKKIQFKPFIPASISSLGDVYMKMGEYEKAIQAYEQSAELSNKIGFVRYQYYPRLMIGDIYLKKGEKDLAKSHFQKALNSAIKNGYESGIEEANERLKSID